MHLRPNPVCVTNITSPSQVHEPASLSKTSTHRALCVSLTYTTDNFYSAKENQELPLLTVQSISVKSKPTASEPI